MGNKINPQSYRIGVVKNWPSRWFFLGKARGASGLSSYKTYLQEDEAIRKVISEKISPAGIASVEIERTSTNLRIFIKAARPGFVIGRGGKGIEELTKAIESALKKLNRERKVSLSVNVEELKRNEVSATYEAQQIAWDIEKRIPFRQALNKKLEAIMQNREIKGCKIQLSGRLDGAEISRREWKTKGSLPLQTLRADIDYGTATAHCSYGAVGIKVWVYKGEVFDKDSSRDDKKQD